MCTTTNRAQCETIADADNASQIAIRTRPSELLITCCDCCWSFLCHYFILEFPNHSGGRKRMKDIEKLCASQRLVSKIYFILILRLEFARCLSLSLSDDGKREVIILAHDLKQEWRTNRHFISNNAAEKWIKAIRKCILLIVIRLPHIHPVGTLRVLRRVFVKFILYCNYKHISCRAVDTMIPYNIDRVVIVIHIAA